jgi:hypothetical protein
VLLATEKFHIVVCVMRSENRLARSSRDLRMVGLSFRAASPATLFA